MKRLINTLLLIAVSTVSVHSQTKRDLETATRLRADFIKATEEYKASLEKLVAFYEQDVKKAEDKLQISEKLFSEGLISPETVESNKRSVESAKAKLAEAKRQQENADKDIASMPSNEDLAREFGRSRQRSRKSKRCASWDLVARQRTSATRVTVSYTFTCR